MSARDLETLVPSVALLYLCAIVVNQLEQGLGLNQLLTKIILGFLIVNIIDVPAGEEAGVNTHSRWLTIGILLIGPSLTLDTIFVTGAIVLVLVLGVTGFTAVLVKGLAPPSC